MINDLKKLWLRIREKAIIGITIPLAILSLVSIYYVLEVNVTSNDECLWMHKRISPDSTAIVFDHVKVEGVTWNAGIRNGDYLLAINNTEVTSPYQAQNLLNSVPAGEYAEYTILKDGEIVKTRVYIKKLVNFGMLAVSLQAFIWLLIGLIVLLAKPDGVVQRYFYLIGVINVLVGAGSIVPQSFFFGTSTEKELHLIAIFGSLRLLGVSAISFVLIHFFWIFPKPFRFTEKNYYKIIMVTLPAIIFISLMYLFGGFYYGNTSDIAAGSKAMNHLAVFFTAANFIAWISLIINYFRLKTKEERKPIFIILVAVTLGIVVGFYTSKIAPAISDTIFNSPEYYAPIVLIVIIPVAFAYSVFKYQLMDVSVVIKKTILYGAAMLTIAAIYFLTVYLLGQSIGIAIGTEYQGIIAGIAFIVFAIIFQSTKDRFQDFITEKMYPEQFAYQKVLIEFSNDIATVVGKDNILDLMTKTFVDALRINKFGILLWSNEKGSFELVRKKGLSELELRIAATNIDEFLSSWSKVNRKIAIEEQHFEQIFPADSDRLKEEGIHTVIPMQVNNMVVGLLLFGLKYSGMKFAGKDIELLYAAASQTGISLENARLYQSETEKLNIVRDLDIARRIQQSLLPQCIPEINGLDICGEMKPAMQVGGDYFDLIPAGKNKIFIIVGDVSGKGLSASLYVSKLQTMVQVACTEDRTPKEILSDLNKKFYNLLERSWFATMTIALIDSEKKIMKYCRAGHVPLIAAGNGAITSFRTKGLAIGIEKGTLFDNTLVEETIPLEDGGVYAFFSDGITEAMNINNEDFGEDRLSHLLMNNRAKTSSQILNSVWESVSRFRGSAPQNDDMTLVVVTVK